MPYTFRAPLSGPLSYTEVFMHMDLMDLMCAQTEGAAMALGGPWPDETFVHVYTEGETTRGVEVGPKGGALLVKALAGSTASDYRLAMKLVSRLAKRHGVQVVDEDGGEHAPAALESHFDAAWVNERVVGDVHWLLDGAARMRPGQAGALFAVGKRVYMGPELVAELRDGDPDDAQLVARVHRRFQQVLYPADHPLADVKQTGDDTTVLWRPGTAMLVPPVDFVTVVCDAPFPIAHAALLEAAGDRARRVDARHIAVDAIPEAEWDTLVQRAGAYSLIKGHATRPDGTLLPVLRPADWPHRDEYRTLPVVSEAMQGQTPGLPWIGFAIDTPSQRIAVPKEGFDEQTSNPDALLQTARRNLAGRTIDWREQRDETGRLVALMALDEYAAELMLSPEHMRVAHERLGAETLAVAAPIGGLLRVQNALPTDPVADVGRLVAWARHCFDDASANPRDRVVSPCVMLVQDGAVTGVVHPAQLS